MRENKFRAWDKELEFFQNEENIFINQDGGIYREEYGEWYNNRYEIQMFTGLKDKNGVEIYEGDIIKGLNRITDNDIPHEVTFLNGCFMIGNWNAHEYFNKHQFIEVVGNVYEHRYLLEDKA